MVCQNYVSIVELLKFTILPWGNRKQNYVPDKKFLLIILILFRNVDRYMINDHERIMKFKSLDKYGRYIFR